MTSEVILMNRRGAIIAADSAVTVGRDPHPRYSKSATKIFEACDHGNVAISIYGSADVDQVPWELAIKQFRSADRGSPLRAKVKDYAPALFTFLQSTPLLFNADVLEYQFKLKVTVAAMKIVEDIGTAVPSVRDSTVALPDRISRWNDRFSHEKAYSDTQSIVPCLTAKNYANSHAKRAELLNSVKEVVDDDLAELVNIEQLTELSIDYLFKLPWYCLSSTGVVFTGFGSDEIFPSFTSFKAYGHIGNEFCFTQGSEQSITHTNTAWIEPFAQSSMINRFTDGFDDAQVERLESELRKQFPELLKSLLRQGATIDAAIASAEINRAVSTTVSAWKKSNWSTNFHPMRRVLASLSMGEMADLAETLLVLESLRERMTSPSESVGGPIDVAVVTKNEGLVWIKRKKYFDAQDNPRYLKRNGL